MHNFAAFTLRATAQGIPAHVRREVWSRAESSRFATEVERLHAGLEPLGR
jgi:hypothetical protein